MEIKLIACDLDGTLMGADHLTVPQENKKALFESHEKGIKIAIATGRTLSSIYPVIDQIPFCDYVIYSNGAGVYDLKSAKNIYSNYIPQKTKKSLVKFVEDYPICYEVYSHGRQYSSPSKIKYFGSMNLPSEFVEEYTKAIIMQDDIAGFALSHDVEKINLYYFGIKDADEINKKIENFSGISYTHPVEGDIEITAKGADKGNALKGLCGATGLDIKNTMAFGDADNDIGMIKAAGLGVAMENAAPQLKAAADYITLDNANCGVACAINRYALGKKPAILVSACLLGENCKYNGTNNFNKNVAELKKYFKLVPVCPEVFAELPIPRQPSEISGGNVFSKDGRDLTSDFKRGAQRTLYIAEENNACFAVMKSHSPSCGKGIVYDGTFSGHLTGGNGVTAEKLIKRGIRVFTENETASLLDELKAR